MRGFAAVLGRELFERRLLGVVAGALGMAAVALPLMPGFKPGGVALADVQGGMAFGFALLLTVLMALFLGGSIVASDLAERRLGFYFARPLPGWAIWSGKMAAALVLVFGAGLLVLVPALLMGGNLNFNGIWGVGQILDVSGPGLFLAWGAGLFLLLFGAHAASVIVRSRSPWAVLDLAAAGVIAALFWTMVRRLAYEGVLLKLEVRGEGERLGIVAWMELGFLAAILLSLLAASAFQVARGRTDPRRGHRILSGSLWGLLGTAALLFAGLGFWILAAGPGDLRGVNAVSASPAGSWIAFSGPAARRLGYSPSFLYDVKSGRSVRARFGLLRYEGGESSVLFSADGRRAVWLELDGPRFQPSAVVVFRLSLDWPGARPVRTSVSFRSPPRSLALSPDGRRLAAFDWQGRLTVDDIDAGRLLASVAYEGLRPWLEFAGNDRLRLYDLPFYQWYGDGGSSYASTRSRGIAELDLTAAPLKVEPTGQIPGEQAIFGWSLAPGAERAILRARGGLQLCDARTGKPLARLADGKSHGAFLADGRIAVTRIQPVELRIFSPDGRSELRRLRFTGVRNLEVVDQPAPGLLRVAGLRTGAPRPSWEVWLVDLETGGTKPQGLRRLAELKPPVLGMRRFSLGDKDGVIWYDPWSSRGRIVLKGS